MVSVWLVGWLVVIITQEEEEELHGQQQRGHSMPLALLRRLMIFIAPSFSFFNVLTHRLNRAV